VDKFNKFRLSGEKPFGKVNGKVQAEGGFGSRQIFVGAIEFGPQRLTDKNSTRPAQRIF